MWRASWLVVCLTSALNAAPATAGDAAPCDAAVLTLSEAADLLRVEASEVTRLAEQGAVPARRVGTSWRFNCTSLMAWLNGDWQSADTTMARRAAPSSAPLGAVKAAPLTEEAMASVTARGRTDGQEPAKPAGAPPTGQDAPIGESPEERPAEDIFLRGQRVLLGRGEVVMDFGQFYARGSAQQLVGVPGGVGLATIEQDVLTTLFVGRVGVLTETEVFASGTFARLDARQILGGTELASNRQSQFGGTAVGIRHTLLREGAGRPDIVFSLNGLLPTGGTTYGAGGGLVAVKSLDPVVLFGSASYLHTFRRDGSDGTRVDSGDLVNVTLGYGLGLNDRAAISMSVSAVFAGSVTVDGATVRQPPLFSGRFGVTTSLTEGFYLEPSVAVGLGGQSNSVSFGVSLPFAF